MSNPLSNSRTMLDRVSTPDNNYGPAPDTRSNQKISVCAVTEQLVSRAVDTQTLLAASLVWHPKIPKNE